MTIFIITLLVAALLTDVLSLVLSVRRIIKGSGSTGIPFLSWVVYYFLIEWMNQTFIFGTPLRAILALTVFHVSCQYLIPLAFIFGMKVQKRLKHPSSQ